jgi:hypothetical protein
MTGRPTSTQRISAGIRRHHAFVWWLVAFKLVLALAFTLLTPAYRGPDEALHVDMIRYTRREVGYPSPAEQVPFSTQVGRTERILGEGVQPRPPLAAADAPERSARPRFAELGGFDEELVDNQMSQHPPLYYAVVAGFTTMFGGMLPVETWTWDREVLLYRFVSVLAAAVLPLLASMVARALLLAREIGALAAAATLLVPMQTFMAGVVNNDAFVAPLTGLAVAGAMAHLVHGGRRSAFVAAGAAAALALTKATGAVVAPWVVLVVVVAYRRHRSSLPVSYRRANLGGVLALSFVGASWYLVNLVRFSDPQPSGVPRPAGPRPEGRSLGEFLPVWLDRVSQGFWGLPARRLGIGLPWYVSHALSALAAIAVVIAVVWSTRRLASLLLALLVAVQVLLMFRTNLAAHLRGGSLPGVQGRYLHSLIVPLGVLVALAILAVVARGRHTSMTETQVVRCAVGCAGVGAFLHVLLVVSMLRGYWEGPDAALGERLAAVLAWSPLPVGVTAVALVAPFAVAIGWVVDRLTGRRSVGAQPAA